MVKKCEEEYSPLLEDDASTEMERYSEEENRKGAGFSEGVGGYPGGGLTLRGIKDLSS